MSKIIKNIFILNLILFKQYNNKAKRYTKFIKQITITKLMIFSLIKIQEGIF